MAHVMGGLPATQLRSAVASASSLRSACSPVRTIACSAGMGTSVCQAAISQTRACCRQCAAADHFLGATPRLSVWRGSALRLR